MNILFMFSKDIHLLVLVVSVPHLIFDSIDKITYENTDDDCTI